MVEVEVEEEEEAVEACLLRAPTLWVRAGKLFYTLCLRVPNTEMSYLLANASHHRRLYLRRAPALLHQRKCLVSRSYLSGPAVSLFAGRFVSSIECLCKKDVALPDTAVPSAKESKWHGYAVDYVSQLKATPYYLAEPSHTSSHGAWHLVLETHSPCLKITETAQRKKREQALNNIQIDSSPPVPLPAQASRPLASQLYKHLLKSNA